MLPHYIAAMLEEIREKVFAALTKAGECTQKNIKREMYFKIYDIEDLIDITPH